MSSVFAQASTSSISGADRAGASAARALSHASAFDAQTVTITLEASVADSYFELLAFEARLHPRNRSPTRHARCSGWSKRRRRAASHPISRSAAAQCTATFEAAVPALEEQRERAVHLLACCSGDTPESFFGSQARTS